MKTIILKIALWLRLPQKIWGDMYIKETQKVVRKAVDKMDIDIKDITITPHN